MSLKEPWIPVRPPARPRSPLTQIHLPVRPGQAPLTCSSQRHACLFSLPAHTY